MIDRQLANDATANNTSINDTDKSPLSSSPSTSIRLNPLSQASPSTSSPSPDSRPDSQPSPSSSLGVVPAPDFPRGASLFSSPSQASPSNNAVPPSKRRLVSDWQRENGCVLLSSTKQPNLAILDRYECDLLLMSKKPTQETLSNLPIKSNAAYIRYNKQLFYINKPKKICIEINLASEFLDRFDQKLKPDEKGRTLSEGELKNITSITDHTHQTINAAYVRYTNAQNQIFYYYINKKTQECKKLELTLEPVNLKKLTPDLEFKLTKLKVLSLDLELRALENPNKWLTDYELKRIEAITGHAHRTKLQSFLYWFGKICTFFIALGCGASTAGTFIGLNLLTGGLASFVASLIFVAGASVNWWIFDRCVSPVLTDFAREKYFVDEKGNPLSTKQMMAVGIALVLSFAVGATFAALTYTTTGTLITAFPFLAFATPALPLIAGVLALATFVSLSALMLKDFADVIKNENVLNKHLKFFRDITNTDPNLPYNQGKPRWKILLERSLTVFLTVTLLGVACIGLWMTMKACVPSIKEILLNNISGLPTATAEIISDVISLVLAWIGQIPFGVITALNTIAKAHDKIFNLEKTNYEAQIEEPQQAHANTWLKIKIGNTGGNAISNGLIAMKGAITDPTSGIFTILTALTSGTFNSAAAGLSAILEKLMLLLPPVKPPKKSRTLESIASQLSPETNKGIAYIDIGCFNPENSTSTSVSQSSSSFFSPSSSSSSSSSSPSPASQTEVSSSSSSQSDITNNASLPSPIATQNRKNRTSRDDVNFYCKRLRSRIKIKDQPWQSPTIPDFSGDNNRADNAAASSSNRV